MSFTNLHPHNLGHHSRYREEIDAYLWNCHDNVEVISKEVSQLHFLQFGERKATETKASLGRNVLNRKHFNNLTLILF